MTLAKANIGRAPVWAVLLFVVLIGGLAWSAIKHVPDELVRLRKQACLPLEPAPGLTVGMATDFTLKDYQGRSVSLSQMRGKVVFLNFWATWCPPCVEEMPSLEALAKAFAGREDFVLLGVSEDKGFDEIRRFFAQGTALTVLLDEDWRVAHEWGTEKLPETFLIDKQGRVRHYIVNKRDWAGPKAAACIESLLEE